MTNSNTSTPLLNDGSGPPKTADEKLMVQNTIRSSPDKVFFVLPRDAKIRKQWCKVMRRDELSATSCLYCCKDHTNVAVRVRPLRSDEGPRAVHCIDDKTLVLEDDADKKDILRQRRAVERHYVYDRVFNEESNEEEVYAATCAPLVSGALRGYAGAVFAYGATGAGKTHTMTALMARTLHQLFAHIQMHDESEAFEVKMSYLEIYNENIRDLLNPSSGYLELRAEGERAGGAPAVAGLAEVRVRGAAEAARLLAAGDRARTAEPTQANRASSRGHALLSVIVSRPLDGGRVLRGRLFLVDLAGSERAGARARRLEGAHINRSLLALGNCINALSGGARYVNYRDSKLTRLLREALGGRCRTAMVAHVAAGAATRDTTRNTLIYAQRATNITNKVERDVMETPFHMSQYRTVISELRKEISRLKAKMKEERPRSVSVSEPVPTQQLAAVSEPVLSAPQSAEAPPDEAVQLKALRHAIVATFKEQMRLRRRLVELDSHLLGLALDAERQHAIISHWEARFNRLYKPMSQPGARLSTQQSYRRGTESAGERTEGEVAVAQAWAELAEVEREQERIRAARRHAEVQLEQVRVRGHQLEEELPARISSSSERELLALVCRVHELEADKLALQGERAARAHQLRRRDAALQRRDAQRQLADEIITRQRHILEECGVQLTSELIELYSLYQQDIHASSYEDSAEMYSSYKLPPIGTGGADSIVPWSSESSGSGRGSSSGGDSEPLGQPIAPLRLPTIAAAPTPRPRTRYSYMGNKPMKRYSSDDSLITAPGNDLEQRNEV